MTEREVQHEPQVLEGENDVPRQPAGRATYEPGAPQRGRAALWVALAVFVAVIATIIWVVLS